MDGIISTLSSKYGHFKKPETNNSPLTYSFMHKVAFIGMIGAIEGIEREKMEELYPILCKDIIFSIRILNPVIKENHGFTKRIVVSENFGARGRRTCEILRNPSYEITIGLKDERSMGVFNKYWEMAKNRKRVYPLNMGNLNNPLDISNLRQVTISEEMDGEFEAEKYSVVSAEHKIRTIDEEKDISFETVPVVEEKWNYIEKVKVAFCAEKIIVGGPYRKNGEVPQWFM